MSNIVQKVKEVIPGTTENKISKATDGTTGYNSNSSAGGLGSGDNYASNTTGGAAYGSGAAAPDYNTGSGVNTTTGEHHGHHHNGGHHHGHHGHSHGTTGVMGGSTVDTQHETTTQSVAKHIPGNPQKEHRLNEGSTGYSTGSGAGYDSTTTGTGYGSTGNDNLGSAGGAGYGSTAGHGATGGGFGTVDTSRETTTQGVAKHIPGTDAVREHNANTEGSAGYGSTGAGYDSTTGTGTGAGYGSTGTTTTGTTTSSGLGAGGVTGSNTTVGTAHESTKDKLLKLIPGTEANKEKKELKAVGQL